MMNKSNELKKQQQYQSGHLRGRISESIKQLHDEVDEVKYPQSKNAAIIPVTSGKAQKYYQNKSQKEY